MTAHDDRVSLRHMLDHSREAVAFVRGKSLNDLERDRLLQLALMRLVEIVGEAAGRVSAPMRASIAEVPWPHVVGMRNRIAHGYDVVDLKVLWDTATDDLPPLIQVLERILADRQR